MSQTRDGDGGLLAAAVDKRDGEMLLITINREKSECGEREKINERWLEGSRRGSNHDPSASTAVGSQRAGNISGRRSARSRHLKENDPWGSSPIDSFLHTRRTT